ncbi:MAG: MBL fold metallo-hydrolase [Clostridia bacterium]|nr:MBL fold metallo-hydrolase [Clostridia bacterium]
MAKISAMFSGSRGNCTFVSSGNSSLIVDAGVSAKQIILAMQQRMLDPEELGGIFITHSHADHVSGLRVLLKKINIPVYASKETLGSLILADVFNSKSRYYDIEEVPELFMDIGVQFFRTSHDCPGSGGYVFTFANGEKAAVCTDLGYISDTVRSAITGVKTVVIESNHDVGMLQNGIYPFATKQRILSDEGHLSNVACANELPKLVKNGTSNIILAHLSRDNNTPDLANVTARSVLVENGFKENKDYILNVAPPSGGKIMYI